LSKQSKIFTELGDENRLKIVEILSSKDLSVNEILEKINLNRKGEKLTQPNLSQHLRRLKYSNIVERSRKGQTFIYSLKKDLLTKQIQLFLRNISPSSRGSQKQKNLL
jgi:ArsR family transcriptional regulator